MRKGLIILLILTSLLFNGFVYGAIDLESETRAYLLGDYETGTILEGFNIDTPVEIASLTKLLSYFVIMDEVNKGSISLEDKIIIDKDIASITGSSFKLKVGEEFTVEDLLKASIVVSANDATYAISKHIAKTEEDFVVLMTKKAKELGLNNAVLYNSTGLPITDKDVQNIMTTRELFILSRELIKTYPQILELTTIPYIEVPERNFTAANTNPLLNEIEGIDGLKTGFTNKAGYCYISTLNIEGQELETEDLRLIGIVMGTKGFKERKDLGKRLMEYGNAHYSKKIILHEDLPLDTLVFPKAETIEVNIFPEASFFHLISVNDNIEIEMNLNEENKLPIRANTSIGNVKVLKNNKMIFETNIIAKTEIEKASIFTLIKRFLLDIFNTFKKYFLSRAEFDKFINIV